MPGHSSLVDGSLHRPGYVQATDPGAVGSGKLWVDTSRGTGEWVLKIRNDADSAWEGVTIKVESI